ncbi:MAG: methylaspartate mutase accessory protein GlmL [Alphaproteobacteria bacterium]|jgi:uncharacterized protein (TIGR01319 family)|nr:methylaspartate mutase accessory protein GlmL [Alphaproteobacteria bacterium]
MAAALLIDFGSTYTKLRAVDLDAAEVLGAGQGPSTVESDVTIGLEAGLADLEARLGGLPEFRYRLAASSAAGGLRMATVGLVKELTGEAARQAALGAGAKLVGTFAYELTGGDVAEIEALAPDILLLAGGTDGGNKEVILANGALLADAALDCPVIVAGNRNAAAEVERRLAEAGKTAIMAENVMPEFGELNIEPARAAIRQVFIDRIVHAKGIDKAAGSFDRVLMPTPAAVLEGARLLSQGTEGRDGLGPLLVIDVGGATTDVHSISSGASTRDDVVVQGLPEPLVKRTVEGDLGMRINAAATVEAAGVDRVAADAGLEPEKVTELVGRLVGEIERLPETPDEAALDRALARAAVRLAAARHAGTVKTVHTPTGPVQVQRGKDLTEVAAVIGTGGVLVHGADAGSVLEAACADAVDPLSLRPRAPRLLIDRDYLLFACGLLAEVEPQAAFDLARGGLDGDREEVAGERQSIA